MEATSDEDSFQCPGHVYRVSTHLTEAPIAVERMASIAPTSSQMRRFRDAVYDTRALLVEGIERLHRV